MGGVEGDVFLEEETSLLRKTFLAGSRFHHRLASRIYTRVRESSLPWCLKRAFSLHMDKVYHVVFTALLGCLAFACFVLAARVSPVEALLASLLVTNLLGLLNEGLDLVTGKGTCDLADMAANLLGSAAVLAPFALWMSARRIRALSTLTP